MVVESSYDLVVRSRVEDFLDLLQEAPPVELSGRHKCILTQQDVLTSQRCVEVFIEEFKRSLVTPFENYFNGVLQVNAHLVRL